MVLVNAIDTSGFVLKTLCETDDSGLEKIWWHRYECACWNNMQKLLG